MNEAVAKSQLADGTDRDMNCVRVISDTPNFNRRFCFDGFGSFGKRIDKRLGVIRYNRQSLQWSDAIAIVSDRQPSNCGYVSANRDRSTPAAGTPPPRYHYSKTPQKIDDWSRYLKPYEESYVTPTSAQRPINPNRRPAIRTMRFALLVLNRLKDKNSS